MMNKKIIVLLSMILLSFNLVNAYNPLIVRDYIGYWNETTNITTYHHALTAYTPFSPIIRSYFQAFPIVDAIWLPSQYQTTIRLRENIDRRNINSIEEGYALMYHLNAYYRSVTLQPIPDVRLPDQCVRAYNNGNRLNFNIGLYWNGQLEKFEQVIADPLCP